MPYSSIKLLFNPKYVHHFHKALQRFLMSSGSQGRQPRGYPRQNLYTSSNLISGRGGLLNGFRGLGLKPRDHRPQLGCLSLQLGGLSPQPGSLHAREAVHLEHFDLAVAAQTERRVVEQVEAQAFRPEADAFRLEAYAFRLEAYAPEKP